MSETPILGACLCGAVRISIRPPTLFCGHCHCTMCQRNHGSAYVTWFGVPWEQTEIVASKKRPSAVHNSTGADWPECSDTIREVAYVKYSVNYCATCQTNGKVLADNTTSKFLK